MQAYGITNRIPHVSILFALHPACHIVYHHIMLTLHKKLNAAELKQYKDSKLRLKPHKFRCYGAVKPLVQLRQLQTHIEAKHPIATTHFAPQSDNLTADLATADFFKCPAGHSRLGVQPCFRPQTPSKAVWCPACHKSISGLKWKCPYNLAWHTCSTHCNKLPLAPPTPAQEM